MEQLTLEQAALIHANKPYHGPIDKVRNISFQKGAEWQKEQYKAIIHLLRQTVSAYDFRYPNERPLLVGYTNEQLFEKINKQLEQLQD